MELCAQQYNIDRIYAYKSEDVVVSVHLKTESCFNMRKLMRDISKFPSISCQIYTNMWSCLLYYPDLLMETSSYNELLYNLFLSIHV